MLKSKIFPTKQSEYFSYALLGFAGTALPAQELEIAVGLLLAVSVLNLPRIYHPDSKKIPIVRPKENRPKPKPKPRFRQKSGVRSTTSPLVDAESRGNILVLVDAENIELSAKEMNKSLNHSYLFKAIDRGASKVTRQYFTAKIGKKNQAFLNKIEKLDCEVVPNDFNCKNRDGSIIHALIKAASEKEVNTVVLVAGDGDYCESVKLLLDSGKRVEVIAFQHSTNNQLRKLATKYIDITSLYRVCQPKHR